MRFHTGIQLAHAPPPRQQTAHFRFSERANHGNIQLHDISVHLLRALPVLRAFKPELLLVSADLDAHRDDPLASIELIEDDYRWITEELVQIANEYCKGRIVSALEGGYNLEALARSVAAHVEVLLNT